jgi:tRNA(adenine34) deaminase
MGSAQQNIIDQLMMTRCIDLARESGKSGEYPYAAVVCRSGTIVAESINRVRLDHDVTRHAEVVAISKAQRALGCVSLDDCEIYANAEPCAFCSYAIRESRIRRVVYGLTSPHMGGVSKWNILTDQDISCKMPEVFAPPPEIVPGFMRQEVERALNEWNPLIARIIKKRGLFVAAPHPVNGSAESRNHRDRIFRFLRRNFFDYFGRR